MYLRAACVALLLVPACLVSPEALAQGEPQDSYCATLGERDRRSSSGARLTDAAAIIRQDRANYHAFGIRDEGDEGDSSFRSQEARSRLETLVRQSGLPRDVRTAIAEGTPEICVDVYGDRVDVSLAGSSGELPFLGVWDCEVGTFTFTPTVYNNGVEDLEIVEIQEGSDGSYTLLFGDDYAITLSGFTGDSMGWFSPASGDNFQCRRMN